MARCPARQQIAGGSIGHAVEISVDARLFTVDDEIVCPGFGCGVINVEVFVAVSATAPGTAIPIREKQVRAIGDVIKLRISGFVRGTAAAWKQSRALAAVCCVNVSEESVDPVTVVLEIA